jgi:PRC-barrel domain protein
MDNMKHRRLQELDRSDFEIVKGEPDIRGWDVKDTSGQKIGEVEELIVDAKEKKVRYMVVDLDDSKLKLHHRKVLVPIGLAELDSDHDDVLTPRISPKQFTELPEYDRNNLTADTERRISSTLERNERSTSAPETIRQPSKTTKEERVQNDEIDPGFYEHENYNLDNLYKNRLHKAQSAKNKNESEYERGLRLWERRSEGGIVSEETRRDKGVPARDRDYYRDMDDETRDEMIRQRRNIYKKRRYEDDDPGNKDERVF